MNTKTQPNLDKSWEQWHLLFEIYQKLGIKIYLIKQDPRLADMCFTANEGWGRNGIFIPSNFRYPQRRPEQEHFKHWLKNHNFKIVALPSRIYFEGQGDVVTTKEAYLFGWGIRSSLEAKDFLSKHLRLNKEIIPLKLAHKRFYHLDTCLMYISPINTILYYPEAFAKESRDRIQKLKAKKIEVTKKEALNLICNGVYYSGRNARYIEHPAHYKDTIIFGAHAPRIERYLEKKGLEVISLDVAEFKKSGGGVRCLTLFLD